MISKLKLSLIAFLGLVASVASAQTNIIGDYTTTKGPDFIGTSSALGNGDFSLETGAQTFAGTSNWFNIAGDETVAFQITNGNVGSPQSASTAAQLSGTTWIGNNTAFVISKADLKFDFSSYLGQFGSAANYGLDTTVTAHLFTSTSGVTDSTIAGDLTTLGTADFTPFNPSSAFFDMVSGTIYTSLSSDIGKTVFLGVSLTDVGNNVFPRMDVVSLSVTDLSPVPEPSSFAFLAGAFALGTVVIRRRR